MSDLHREPSSCFFLSHHHTSSLPHNLQVREKCEFYVRVMFCADGFPLRHFPTARVSSLQHNCLMGVRWRSSKPPLVMFPPRDPSLSHHCTSVKILWDSKGRLPALTPRFLISCSLMSGVSPHRSKLKASRTSRTSSVWWLWLERTPPLSLTSSPSTTSASRRSATTTRLTCKMLQSTSIMHTTAGT